MVCGLSVVTSQWPHLTDGHTLLNQDYLDMADNKVNCYIIMHIDRNIFILHCLSIGNEEIKLIFMNDKKLEKINKQCKRCFKALEKMLPSEDSSIKSVSFLHAYILSVYMHADHLTQVDE